MKKKKGKPYEAESFMGGRKEVTVEAPLCRGWMVLELGWHERVCVCSVRVFCVESFLYKGGEGQRFSVIDSAW